MTGRRYERRLVSELWDEGWGFVKSPSSGSGRKHPQPDMAISRPGEAVLGVEAKSTRQDAYTVNSDEASDLREWCGSFGAEPVIAIYWKGPKGGNVSYGGWWFLHADDVRTTRHGNLRPRRENRHDWLSMDQLASITVTHDERQ